MSATTERLYKALEVLQPALTAENNGVDNTEVKESTPASRVTACKTIVSSLSALSGNQNEEYPRLLSMAFEQLLSSCNDDTADVRVAADEGLNHLINELYGSDSSRIQIELFREIKRNASSRRVKAAIVRFAELAYLIKPQKCRAYVMNLLPLLISIFKREEESIQESLITSVPKIVSVLGPFFSETELHSFLSTLFTILVSKISSSRRMSAECITSLCHNCLKPGIFYSIALEKMLTLTINPEVESHFLNGGFLGLRKILISASELPRKEEDQYFFNLDHIAAIYLAIFKSLDHKDHNVLTSALAVLQTLVQQCSAQLLPLFLSDLEMWRDKFKGKTLGDLLLGTKHSNKNMMLGNDADATYDMDLSTSTVFTEGKNLITASAMFLTNKFLVRDGEKVKAIRVSVQSLVINCLAEFIVSYPSLLPDNLSHLPSTFKDNCDPMLQSNIMIMCGYFIYNYLHKSYYLGWSPHCEEYINMFIEGIKDESPKVQKACCDAAKVCIPAILKTKHCEHAINLIKALLTLHTSSYWLTKTSLLDVIKDINFSYIHCYTDKVEALQEETMNAVFNMMSEEDGRVQTAAALCLSSIVDNLCFNSDPGMSVVSILEHDYFEAIKDVNPPIYEISLPSDSSHKRDCLTSKNVGSLSRLLNIIFNNMLSSKSRDMVHGCIETISYLSEKYVNGEMLKCWGITIPSDRENLPPILGRESGSFSGSSGLISYFTSYLTCSIYMYDIHCHQNLLTIITKLIGSTCKYLIANRQINKDQDMILSWAELNDDVLVEIIESLIYHIMRVLNICCHVCGEIDPYTNINFKDKMSAVANKRKKKDDDLIMERDVKTDSLNEIDPSGKVGSFLSLPHYMKLYENLKASYEAHKVSLNLQSDEKFVLVLRRTLLLFQEILKYSSLKNIGAFSEEVNGYLTILLRKEPIQCVTTTRYILSALFGTNVICDDSALTKPLNLDITMPIQLTLSSPAHLQYFKFSPYLSPAQKEEVDESEEEEDSTSFPSLRSFSKKFQRPKKKPVAKAEPKPLMQNYIRYFEDIVIKSLRLYTVTNNTQVQGEILTLLIDLLRLRVNYSLLDTDRVFVNFLLKQFEFIEQGQTREASKLLPTLFQFLLMLTREKYQEESVIDIPRIMQLCGTAMASGQLNTASISVSLYPLIHELFLVQESSTVPEVLTQREVVENILLKNVIHYQVIDILWIVLNWYLPDFRNFTRYSASVWSAVSIAISQDRLDISSPFVMTSMHRLLDVICHDNSDILNTLIEFTTSAKNKEVKCSFISLVLRYLLVAIARGHLESILAETGQAMLAAVGVFKEQQATNNILLKFIIWSLNEILEALKSDLDSPSASFSSLNYIYKLVYYVKDTSNITVNIDDPIYKDIQDKLIFLPCKYPTSVITVVKVGSVLGVNFQPQSSLYDTSLVSKYVSSISGTAEDSPKKNSAVDVMRELREISNLPPDTLLTGITRMAEILQTSPSYSTLMFASSCADVILAKLEISAGTLAYLETSIDCLILLRSTFDNPVTSVADRCNELLAQLQIDEPVEDEPPCITNTQITAAWLKTYLSSFICVTPANPLSTVPILKNIDYRTLQDLISNPTFDTELLTSMILVGRNELCSQKSAYIGPEDILPQLPQILVVTKNELLQRVCHLTGVTAASLTSKPVQRHTHKKSNSTSLPKSIALFVDTSAFSTIEELLQHNECWEDDEWVKRLNHYISAVTALLNTGIIYSDIASLSPYNIHGLIRLLALALQVHRHRKATEIGILSDLLEFLLSIIVTHDTCAILHYGEEMNIVENVHYILFTIFGIKDQETKIDKVREMVNFVLYSMPSDKVHPRSFLNLVRKCILSLASLPCVSSHLRIPSFLALASMREEETAEFTLSSIALDFLKDSEVLTDFLYRNLSFGWSTKRQFEELWVTMLGMITYRFDDDLSREEIVELSVVNVLAVRGMTALLVQTLLYPVPGAPTTSIYQHFPRVQQISFLETVIGQRMIFPHKLISDKLLQSSKYTPDHQNCLPDLNCYIDNDFSNCLIDSSDSKSSDRLGVFIHNIERIPGSSSYYSGFYSASALRERVITNDVTDLDDDGENRVQSEVLQELSDSPDVISCLHFLVDLFAEWTLPESNIPITLLNQIVDSVIQLSDMFQKTSHCRWMVDGLLRILIEHPLEDKIMYSKLLLGLCKSVSLLQADKAGEKLLPFLEEGLSSDFIMLQLAVLKGSFFLLESHLSCFEESLVPLLSEFVVVNLVVDHTQPLQFTLALWGIAVLLLEKYPEEIELYTGYMIHVLQFGVTSITTESTPFVIHHAVTRGLQRLVLFFALDSTTLDTLTQVATDQLDGNDPQKCLSSFGLLMSCMYCGKEGSRVMDLDRDQVTIDTTLAGAMDKMRKILDCVSHCCHSQAKPLASVVSYLIHDFFPKEQMINTFVSEFLSPRQQNRQLISLILYDLFQSMIKDGKFSEISEWVILVLRNFVQLKPIKFSVWCTSILLLCSTKNHNLGVLFPHILHSPEQNNTQLFGLLCKEFYLELPVEDRVQFVAMLKLGSEVHGKNYNVVLNELSTD